MVAPTIQTLDALVTAGASTSVLLSIESGPSRAQTEGCDHHSRVTEDHLGLNQPLPLHAAD